MISIINKSKALLIISLIICSIVTSYANTKIKSIVGKNDSVSNYAIPENPNDISPLLIGEIIPAAMLQNINGDEIDLAQKFKSKPTVLIFYRGGWCPFCSKQLASLQEISSGLVDLGYQIIAVSTDKPEILQYTKETESLNYELLSDSNLKLAMEMGLAFKAPKSYNQFLPETTGGKNINLLLPVPAVFIVDKMGKINFEYINPNYKERINPKLLMSVAETLISDLK